MKRINYLAFVMLLGLSVIFTGCSDDDEPTPPPNITITNPAGDVDGNGIPNGVVTYDYSIVVKGLCTCGPCKTEGLTGATVTLNGETKTTDASGIVRFEDLNQGAVSFFVEKAGFASMNFTATLAGSTSPSDVDQVIATSTSITLFKTDASVEGRVMAAYNGLGTAPNFNKPPALQVVMTLTYDVNTAQYNGRYNGSGLAISMITSASFDNASFSTNLNNTATYKFENVLPVPDASAGLPPSGVSARFKIKETTNQTLGSQSYRLFQPGPLLLTGSGAPSTINSIECSATVSVINATVAGL